MWQWLMRKLAIVVVWIISASAILFGAVGALLIAVIAGSIAGLLHGLKEAGSRWLSFSLQVVGRTQESVDKINNAAKPPESGQEAQDG